MINPFSKFVRAKHLCFAALLFLLPAMACAQDTSSSGSSGSTQQSSGSGGVKAAGRTGAIGAVEGDDQAPTNSGAPPIQELGGEDGWVSMQVLCIGARSTSALSTLREDTTTSPVQIRVPS